MNKLIILAGFSGILFLAAACKKEPEPTPEPTPVTPAPPTHVNSFTAQIDGTPWIVGDDPNTYVIGPGYVNGTPKHWTIRGGKLGSNDGIYLEFPYTIGTVSLSGSNFASYTDSAGKYFTAISGTMHISEFDTTHTTDFYNKLKATFAFTTNVVSGTSHTITGGNVDYLYK